MILTTQTPSNIRWPFSSEMYPPSWSDAPFRSLLLSHTFAYLACVMLRIYGKPFNTYSYFLIPSIIIAL